MKNTIPYNLIAAYFSGECSAPEKQKLQNWRNSNLANQKLFNQFREVWEKSEESKKAFSPDTESALEKVNREIEMRTAYKKKNNKTINKLVYFGLRIAAVLIIGAGILLGYYLSQKKSADIYVEETTTKAEKQEIILADGSTVWLNSFGKLKYPSEFSSEKREVWLEGEAFFEITKNPEKPFIIHAQNSLTQVLGTSFNIRAIPDEKEVVVTVIEGKVAFYNKAKDNGKSLELIAGDKGILNKNNSNLKKHKNADSNFLSWKTGILDFNNMPLQEVIRELSEYYNTDIEITDTAINEMKITTTFPNMKIDEVMKSIGLTLERQGVEIQFKKPKYVIKRKAG